MSILLVVVVATALVFDYTNGFHDAANAVATAISTRALSPRAALLLAAVLNIVGALLSTTVAATIAHGIVEPGYVTLPTVLAGLFGAIAWNLFTWYFGIPCSSSHCLIGGVAGSVSASYGLAGVKWLNIFVKVIVPTVVSPVLGFIGGGVLTVVIVWLLRKQYPGPMKQEFRRLQMLSSAFLALSHGLNDAQKTMGIITLALVASGSISSPTVPLWAKLACAVTMGLGTFVGGKRIIRTLGVRLVKLTPVDGFAAQMASSLVLQGTALLGCPISTTHVAATTIMGVGATYNPRSVRWDLTRNIVLAWIFTLPASALVGAGLSYAFKCVGLK
jgi:inorganic phosphate transporter, PiT family